jgi:ribosome-associated protein
LNIDAEVLLVPGVQCLGVFRFEEDAADTSDSLHSNLRSSESYSLFPMGVITVTDTVAIDEREIEERFVRASGPGGQNVNKVSSAVELRFNVAASSLSGEVKARLINLAGKKMNSDGVLLIDSREYRTQSENRVAARERLVALIRHALVRPRARRKTRPTAGSRERRLTEKKHRSDKKQTRSRSGGED